MHLGFDARGDTSRADAPKLLLHVHRATRLHRATMQRYYPGHVEKIGDNLAICSVEQLLGIHYLRIFFTTSVVRPGLTF